jgi:hypothetical protein
MFFALVYREPADNPVPTIGPMSDRQDGLGTPLPEQMDYWFAGKPIDDECGICTLFPIAQVYATEPYVDPEAGYPEELGARLVYFTLPVKIVGSRLTLLDEATWERTRPSLGSPVRRMDHVSKVLLTYDKPKSSIILGAKTGIHRPGASNVPSVAPTTVRAGTSANSSSVQIDMEKILRELETLNDRVNMLAREVLELKDKDTKRDARIAMLFEHVGLKYDTDTVVSRSKNPFLK